MKSLLASGLGQPTNVTLDDQRRQSSTLQIDPTNRLEDVFRMCSDTNSQVNTLIGFIKTLSTRMSALEEEVRQLRDVTGRTQAIVGSAVYTDNEACATPHAKDAQVTKKVSSAVVAAVIRSIWYDNMGLNIPLPLDMKYLSSLCNACFGSMDGASKSNVGVMLTEQIASIDSDANAGSYIIAVLTSTSNVLASNMRKMLLDCIKLLGTTYAFMIPYELAALLNRVTTFSEDKTLLNGSVNETVMVRPHGGYNIKGDAFTEPRYMKAFIKTTKIGNTKPNATRLCKAIEQNMVTGTGDFICELSNAKISEFSKAINKDTINKNKNTASASLLSEVEQALTPTKKLTKVKKRSM